MPYALITPSRLLRRGLFLFACAMGCAPAFAQVDPHALYPQYRDTRIVYYDVDGETPWDVVRRMAALGPVAFDGGNVDGQTQWNVSWELRNELNGRCIADARLTTTVTLPRLVGGGSFTQEEWSAWDQFIWALIDHEFGHVAIAHLAFVDLEAALAGGPCAGAHERADAVLERAQWQQVQYDRDTRHGQLTGVRFP